MKRMIIKFLALGVFSMIVLSESIFAGESVEKQIDIAKIANVIESVANYADTHQFKALEGLYAPEVILDYSSLSGEPAQVRSPQSFIREWAGVLPGFDVTRHIVDNINIAIDVNIATVTADVVAKHYVDGMSWQVSGQYRYRLIRDIDRWLITLHTFLLKDELGSRKVFGPAIENAKANPVSYLTQKVNEETISALFEAEDNHDIDIISNLWAHDGIKEIVHTSTADFIRLEGKENIMSHYQREKSLMRSRSDIRFHLMQDPQLSFVEFFLLSNIDSNNKTQPGGSLFYFDGGKVQLQRQYF